MRKREEIMIMKNKILSAALSFGIIFGYAIIEKLV